MVKPAWILVADASQARILQKQSGASFEMVHSFSHPQSRLKASDLGSDSAGREMGSAHFGGAAYEARTRPKRKEHGQFAHEIAEFLDTAAHAGRFSSVSIFAASPFLGEIKQALGAATERMLAEVYDVNLSAVSVHELQDRIDSHRATGHR